jgi:hypothetical protein
MKNGITIRIIEDDEVIFKGGVKTRKKLRNLWKDAEDKIF